MTAESFGAVDHIDLGIHALELEFGAIDTQRVQQMASVLRARKINQTEIRRAVRALIEDGCKGKFPRTADILKAARPGGVNLGQEFESVDALITLEREREVQEAWRAKFENEQVEGQANSARASVRSIEKRINNRLNERGLPSRYDYAAPAQAAESENYTQQSHWADGPASDD